MKKTNKTFKRFAAITSASLLAACAVAPVAFNAFAAPNTIEIDGFNTENPNDATTHEFEAYQIFDGDISGEGTSKVLINIKWGSGIDNTKYQELLNALAAKNDKFVEKFVYVKADDATDVFDTAYTEWQDAQKELEGYVEGETDISQNAFYNSLDADKDAELIAMFKVSEKKAYTYSATDDKSAEAIADVLATVDDDDQLAKDFAEVVGKYLSTVKEDSHVVTEDEAVDKDEVNGIAGGTYAEFDKGDVIIPGLDDGYYLIQDKDRTGIDVNGENNGAKTRFILKVTDNAAVEVNVKASAPTVMKKVQEDSLTAEKTGTVDFAGNDEYNPGTGYNDVADYAIGDAVPFKLYGTMPSTLDDYDHYYYKFTDTLGEEFDKPTNVKITIGDTALYYKPVNTEVSQGVFKWVYTQYDENFANAINENIDNNCSLAYDGTNFTIEFTDIKKYDGVDKNTVVTVEYDAVLNNKANIGYEGQLNKVKLEYSNNPNEEYKPWDDEGNKVDDKPDGTGETKEDGVIVFTYGFDINKFTEKETNKLAGAKFAAYYYGADGTTKNYLVVEDGLFTGETVATPTESTNSVWTSSTSGNIEIKGLDVGTYYITEIEAPEGYNPLNSDIEVVVASSKSNGAIYTQNWTYSEKANFVYTYANDEDTVGTKVAGEYTALDKIELAYGSEPAFTIADAEQAANEEEGILWAELEDLGTVDIENKAGTALPGTGGIGTTIFYLGGGAMAAIGGIYLISKRRMRKSEE